MTAMIDLTDDCHYSAFLIYCKFWPIDLWRTIPLSCALVCGSIHFVSSADRNISNMYKTVLTVSF